MSKKEMWNNKMEEFIITHLWVVLADWHYMDVLCKIVQTIHDYVYLWQQSN